MNVLGIVRCYSDLHRLMRARCEQIGITRETLDDIAGIADGLASKILAPKPIKRMGELVITEVLPVLGAQLLLVEDEEALKRTLQHHKYRKRDEQAAKHAKTVHIQFSYRRLRAMQKKGGENSRKYLTASKRKQLARRAARARWSKHAAR